MDDLISRQAAIEALETVGYDFSESELSEVELEEVCGAVSDVRQDMIGRIKQLPPAQPAEPERQRGAWIEYIPEHGKCPFCGNKVDLLDGSHHYFCEECGAQLEVTE